MKLWSKISTDSWSPIRFSVTGEWARSASWQEGGKKNWRRRTKWVSILALLTHTHINRRGREEILKFPHYLLWIVNPPFHFQSMGWIYYQEKKNQISCIQLTPRQWMQPCTTPESWGSTTDDDQKTRRWTGRCGSRADTPLTVRSLFDASCRLTFGRFASNDLSVCHSC